MSDNAEQPPVTNRPDLPATWELVIDDMRERDVIGREKYSTPLQPFNGRNSLVDAYQEALDMAVYLKNEILERRPVNEAANRLRALAIELGDPAAAGMSLAELLAWAEARIGLGKL